MDMAIDKAGNYWLLAKDFRREKVTFFELVASSNKVRFIKSWSSLADSCPEAITVDSGSNKWLSTNDGVLVYHEGGVSFKQ